MLRIAYNKNQNGKLFNEFFTAIRKANARDYQSSIGENYMIMVRNQDLFKAKLIDASIELSFNEIPTYTLCTDMGVSSRKEAESEMTRFYGPEFDKEKYVILLFKRFIPKGFKAPTLEEYYTAQNTG
jgi:hypothetical protein